MQTDRMSNREMCEKSWENAKKQKKREMLFSAASCLDLDLVVDICDWKYKLI